MNKVCHHVRHTRMNAKNENKSYKIEPTEFSLQLLTSAHFSYKRSLENIFVGVQLKKMQKCEPCHV